MANTIASLAVNVVANTKQLVKGLGKATKATKSFAKKIGGITKSVVKFGTALTAAAAAAAIAFVNSQRHIIDALGKTADKLGVNVELLQRYQHVAELSGLSTEIFDTALQRIVRRAGEAANGTGEAVKAFEELGISADKFIRLGMDEQMRTLAKAFEGVETQADKVRLMMKLADTEGVGLVNMVGKGSEALAQMEKQADATGRALTREQVAAVEKMNDTIANMVESIVRMGRHLVADLVPVILDVARITTKWATEFGGWLKFATNGAEDLSQALSGIRRELDQMYQQKAPKWLTFLTNMGRDLASRNAQARFFMPEGAFNDPSLQNFQSVGGPQQQPILANPANINAPGGY